MQRFYYQFKQILHIEINSSGKKEKSKYNINNKSKYKIKRKCKIKSEFEINDKYIIAKNNKKNFALKYKFCIIRQFKC